MPRDPNHSEHSSILPEPKLNPLLNPVLGEHMGRWAEVYFTNPPEKREQAVIQLLREIEAENALRADVAPAPLLPAVETLPNARTCPACGRENPAQQNFCGMCGARLGAEPPMARTYDSQDARGDTSQAPEPLPKATYERGQSQFLAPPRLLEETIPTVDEPALFPQHDDVAFEDDGIGDDGLRRLLLGTATSSTPYSLYIGAAVAILLAALVVIAWGSRRTLSGTSLPPEHQPARVNPEAPVNPQTARTSANPAPSKTEPGTAPVRTIPVATVHDTGGTIPGALRTSAIKPSTSANTTPSKTEPSPAPVRTIPVATVHDTSAKVPIAVASSALEPSTLGGGYDDLAAAQKYLQGMNGAPRNPALALPWLWKAVGKRNAPATMLLSDLYLKGDGVPKNCDQARILLDAAARKGMKDAAERLRNLPAFGCQ